VHELRDIPLRSDDPLPPEIVGLEEVDDFVVPESFVAIRPAKDSNTDFWFIYIISTNLCSIEDVRDDYNGIIPKANVYHTGYFLEKINFDKKSRTYKMEKSKVTFFYKESVLFPFVNFHVNKGDNLILKNEDYTDIVVYIEQNSLIHV